MLDSFQEWHKIATPTTQLENKMTTLNILQSNIWEAYKNHKFWCQRHSEYPMDRNSFFGNYELKALDLHNKGLDISDKSLLDPLHGYNGEIDYDYMQKSGYKA